MSRMGWALVAQVLLFTSLSAPARAVAPATPTSNLGATLSVSYKFRNGDRIGDSLNGYICVQCSDPSLVPTGEGHEVLAVHVTDPGGTRSPGKEVKVRINSGQQNFYFQGSPSTVEMVNLTDTGGDATFNFAAQLNLGVAGMTISVADAGFSADAVGSSFKMTPQLLNSTVTGQVQAGTPFFVGTHGPRPAGSGPGQFHLGGAFAGCAVVSSKKVPQSLDEVRVQAVADFKITETPATPKAHAAMLSRDIRVDQYREFSSLDVSFLSASVKNEKSQADAGFRVEIQTTDVQGIPVQYNFPAGNFTYSGVSVPHGVIGPGKIVKSEGIDPFGINLGPAVGAGWVLIVFEKQAVVVFNVYWRAQASGNNASAAIDMDNLYNEIQAVPKRLDDLFGP